MKINKKIIGGFLLIVFGIFVFFGGGSFGFIILFVIGSLMIYVGMKRFVVGKMIIGIILGGIGVIMFICLFLFVVGIVLVVVMVYYGWKFMKNGLVDNGVLFFDFELVLVVY